MPVILPRGSEDTWLDAESDPDDLVKLLKPYGGPIDAYEISKRVNAPANDKLECIVPLGLRFQDDQATVMAA